MNRHMKYAVVGAGAVLAAQFLAPKVAGMLLPDAPKSIGEAVDFVGEVNTRYTMVKVGTGVVTGLVLAAVL